MKKALLLSFCLWFCLGSIQAQSDAEKDNLLKTKSVSIFKNGSGFFIKEGKVKTTDGAYVMSENLPQALFGTFWVHSPAQQLRHISSYQDYVTKKSESIANSPIALLQANKGKKVKLYIREDKEVKEYDGVVEEVMIKDEKGEEKSFIDNNLIIFRTGGRWLSLRPSAIWRVEFMEKPNQVLERETNTRQNVLEVLFTTKNSEQPLEMMYLQNGINWTPVYLMTLKNETTAELELRAEVANNAEDIKDAEVSFVVGIPNFKYANQLSSLVDFLQLIHPNRDQYSFNNFSNSISSQSLGYASDKVQPGSVTNTIPAMGGAQGSADEDLFFYQIKNVSLKKGGRGQYPIFKKEIDISHIYECNLPQNSVSRGYYQKEFLFSPDNQNPVFHSVKISNKSSSPFTTGAVMVVSEKSGTTRPISQDILNYTPMNGHSYIKFTEAPDIKVKQAEKEVDRDVEKKKIQGSKPVAYYDLVTIEGKIEVRNYKNKPVNMNVKRTIVGELGKSNVKWLKAERVNYSGHVNDTTDVCWETEVPANGTLEIVYRYKVFVRN